MEKHQRKTAREERNKRTTKEPENNKMALVNLYLSVSTLNVNGLNSPIKRHRVAKWTKQTEKTQVMLVNKDSLKFQGHT